MYTNPFNQLVTAFVETRYQAVPRGWVEGQYAPIAMPTLAIGVFCLVKICIKT